MLRRAYPRAVPRDDGFDLPGSVPQHVAVGAVACKVWSADPGLTLMAVPRIEAEPASADETRGDVEILVLDSTDGRILVRRIERGMAFADAIRFEGVTLDTARYDIRPGLRAFGLRTEQAGSSRANPFGERALWLYTIEGDRIVRVLDGLIVERMTGETDGSCAGHARTVRRVLSLGAEGRDGYRDLVVDQTETATTRTKAAGPGADGPCRSADAPGPRSRQVLRFGNGRYEAPAGLRRPGDGWFSSIMTPPAGPAR